MSRRVDGLGASKTPHLSDATRGVRPAPDGGVVASSTQHPGYGFVEVRNTPEYHNPEFPGMRELIYSAYFFFLER